jgi:rsbT co-antagonist protein RsbR
MNNRVRDWLDNLPLTDPVERRQASAFQLVLIGWIILAVAGVPALFLQPSPPSAEPMPPTLQLSFALLTIAGTSLWLSPISALVLLRRGRFRLAVAVATFGLLLGHSLATFLLGVTNGSVLVVFQIPIALVGLLGSRRLLLTVAGLSITVVVVVGILESLSPPLAGFFTNAINASETGGVSPSAGQSVGLDVGFFIAATLLLTLLLDRFGSALRDALTRSLEREEELQIIRDSLEATIGERTAALQTALQDVEARAEAQAQLLAEIEEQRTMIKDLSVPIIPISADTLVMPLVGALDSTRLRQLQEQSLQALERTSARTLVLDITGVPIVDTQVAQGFLITVRSARLLGAEVMLVGIRPEVAQTIVGLGIDLRDVHTFSDLQSALARIPTNGQAVRQPTSTLSAM